MARMNEMNENDLIEWDTVNENDLIELDEWERLIFMVTIRTIFESAVIFFYF